MGHPERLVVGHPFNPVYLLPLVEVCGGRRTVARRRRPGARRSTASVGMRPLRARARRSTGSSPTGCSRRCGARRCGSSTTAWPRSSQIDDAIRFGAGLRWSAMGTFLVYRMAGGEAGMRHFMAQFGPALQWPWSKLTDVPELTDELLDRLVEQSDEQAGGPLDPRARGAARRLPRRGDAGAARRSASAPARSSPTTSARSSSEPAAGASRSSTASRCAVHEQVVPDEWVDYNGHTNDSRYMQLSSAGLDGFLGSSASTSATWRPVAPTSRSRATSTISTRATPATGCSSTCCWSATTRSGCTCSRRCTAATTTGRGRSSPPPSTCCSTSTRSRRKAAPAGDDVLGRLAEIARAHADIPRPEQLGRHVGQRR